MGIERSMWVSWFMSSGQGHLCLVWDMDNSLPFYLLNDEGRVI
jgi:hypothetical protein